MAGAERRRTARVPTRNLVTNASLENKRVTTAVDNLSLGGAFLRTSQPFAVGARVVLELFEAHSRRPFLVAGKVVLSIGPSDAARRRVTSGIGVEFDELSAGLRERLALFVEGLGTGPARASLRTVPKVARPPAPASGEIKRRRNRRLRSKGVSAKVQLKGEVIALAAPVDNLSMGGLFLIGVDPLHVAASIEIELLYGGRAVQLTAEVAGAVSPATAKARNVPAGIAVRFGPMRHTTAKALREILVALSPAAASDLLQEVPIAGYLPDLEEAEAPVDDPSVRVSGQVDLGSVDIDTSDFGANSDLDLEPKELVEELNRLEAEIAERRERVAQLKRRLRPRDEPP